MMSSQFFRFILPGGLFLMVLLAACKDEADPVPQVPAETNVLEVLTDANSLRYENGKVLISSSVTSKDGYSILEKGVCFGSAALPKLKTDSVLSAGSGFGTFTTAVSFPGYRQEWFLRPFAISRSSSGKTDTTFGNQLTIRPFHQVKTLSLIASGTDSIRVNWAGISPCRITGLEAITAKGFCWSLNPNPKPGTSNFVSSANMDSLSMAAFVTGLQAGQLYYFRAFAATAADTIFGPNTGCSTGLRDAEGRFYPSIVIGKQVWMAANLRSEKFSDLTPLENDPNNARWDSIQIPASAMSADSLQFGRFYNYHCIISPKNLCPAGWSVPTRSDWDTLFRNLGGWENAGLALKAGTTAWGSSIPEAQGSSGFKALPAGQKLRNGIVQNAGKLGFWWVAGSSVQPACFKITDLNNGIFLQNADAQQGFSVRCLKKP